VDDTRDVTQNCQEDVDQQISAAATLKEYTQWREDDRQDDLEDIGAREGHCNGGGGGGGGGKGGENSWMSF